MTMTAYSSSIADSLYTYESLNMNATPLQYAMAESITTDDTLGKSYTAVRPITDTPGRAELGNVGLPLLFTSGGTPDAATRYVNADRISVEQLKLTDGLSFVQHMSYTLVEYLAATDTVSLQQSMVRHLSDTIYYGGDSVTHHLNAYRALLEQCGNDLLISPMLLFPSPRNDVLVRFSAHPRALSDTLTHSDVLRWLSGFSRHYTETLSTSDSMTRRLAAIHRALTETLSPSDVPMRHLTYLRVLAEHLTTVDALLRGLSIHRTPSESLSTSAVLTWLHSAPRSLSEHLTTTDAITFEQLLQAIMGYIWEAADGTVQADLPDWGFILVEDPVNGNFMNTIPVPVTTLDPTREK